MGRVGRLHLAPRWPRNPRWSALFHDPRATAPIISLFVAPDFAVAVTADGGILEGRKGL